MKTSIWKALLRLASMSLVVGCGTASDPKKRDDNEEKTYDICKYKSTDGTVSDNCAFAVLENGTCGKDNYIIVKSTKPANEYTCMMEL